MTYKLGPLYLTTLTFPNSMFDYKNNEGKHPKTLAAVMTSVTKEEYDYEYMARCLKTEGIQTIAYGTDGKCALESCLESVYPLDGSSREIIHLGCFYHARSDILHQLKSIKISVEERKKIVQEIPGKEYNAERVKALVNCDTREEFDQLHVNKEKDWPKDFRRWMEMWRGWLGSLKDTLKQCMLKPNLWVEDVWFAAF